MSNYSSKNPSVIVIFVVTALLIHCNIFAATTLSAEEILTRTNEFKDLINQGVEWKIKIALHNAQGIQHMTVQGKQRGPYSVYFFEDPEHLKGTRAYIAKDKLWLWKPGQKRPFPITNQQNLFGLASYGDIFSIDYAKVYKSELVGEEVIDNRINWKFTLTSLGNNVTYDKIKYWVDQSDFLIIKAEFYLPSGKLAKSAIIKYDNYVVYNGKQIPFLSEITIHEHLKFEEATFSFFDAVLKKIPDEAFSLNSQP